MVDLSKLYEKPVSRMSHLSQKQKTLAPCGIQNNKLGQNRKSGRTGSEEICPDSNHRWDTKSTHVPSDIENMSHQNWPLARLSAQWDTEDTRDADFEATCEEALKMPIPIPNCLKIGDCVLGLWLDEEGRLRSVCKMTPGESRRIDGHRDEVIVYLRDVADSERHLPSELVRLIREDAGNLYDEIDRWIVLEMMHAARQNVSEAWKAYRPTVDGEKEE